MRNTNIMIILPPALKAPGMVKSPPLDIANLTAILKRDPGLCFSITDFRKNTVQDSLFYQKKGIDLSVFSDLKRCLRHFLAEDIQISRTVGQITAGMDFSGLQYAVFSVSVLEQFSLPLLMASACMARQVKKESPQAKIIFFGNCPETHVAKIKRLFKFIDAFPAGGNEFHVLDYIQGRGSGSGRMAMDSMPLADFSLLDLESYKCNGRLVLPYELSRGCSSRCFFCYYIYKGTINTKDPAKAVADFLALSRRYGTDLFHLTDAAVNLDPDWLMRLCDLLAQQPQKVQWCALAIPKLSPLMMDKMKAAGCVQLRLGVESGSERMLKKINKGTTTESIKNTLAYAHSIGINNYITLITGLPGELESDIQETKDFIEEIAPYVDSAQECIYGELGYFSLEVFKRNVRNKQSRYKQTFERLDLKRVDIIDFLAGQAPQGRERVLI